MNNDNQTAGTTEERRKYKRIRKEMMSFFEVIESPDEMNPAGKMKTQDISFGGILFDGTEPLQIGTILKLEFQSSANELRPGRLMCRVVRIEEIKPYEKYEIGVAFLNLRDEQKEAISMMIGE